MCGIAGILNFNQSLITATDLQRMTDIISHRGPDGEGYWINPDFQVGLGHRRLAIIDLSDNGAQPMCYAGRFTITYNGEIYNYIELRERLRRKGYRFISESDTEVLLAAYEEYGVGVLEHLDGMFAFAIWDEREKQLFCARDRFGEKPLFYQYVPGRHFVFASEIKSLLAFGAPRRLNYNMLFYYLAYDVVENPYDKRETFYDGIHKLEAAHYLTLDAAGNLHTRRYWSLPPVSIDRGVTFEEACDQFRELFYESVKRRMRSDVPVGTSLSGGLDSSSIVCVMTELLNGSGQRPKTFSARFDDDTLDEGWFIKKVTKTTGAESFFTWPNSDTLLNEIDRVFYHQEEPFGSASIVAQWEVMKLAQREGVTVLLDGQGADETVGGYVHFFRPLFMQLFVTDKKRFAQEIKAYENLRNERFLIDRRYKLEAKWPAVLRFLGRLRRMLTTPNSLQHLHPEFVSEYKQVPLPFRTFRDLNEALRFATQDYGLEKLLRFSDRNAMAFSREVRLPFLNHKLVEFLFTLPESYKISGGWTKLILRTAMSEVLPMEIAWRVDKLGFMPPQKRWLQQPAVKELIYACRQRLSNERIFKTQECGDDWKVIMTASLLKFTPN